MAKSSTMMVSMTADTGCTDASAQMNLRVTVFKEISFDKHQNPKITLHDKLAALHKLAQHHKLLSPDIEDLPIARIELSWILIAFTWGLIMFFMMIYWHGAGKQNLSNEAYQIKPQAFAQKAQAMIDEYHQCCDY